MKYTSFFSLLLIAAFAFFAWTSPDNDAWKKKVDTALLISAQADASTDFMVLFAEKADISAAAHLKTKEEKGQYVFQKLKQTAANSQQAVQALLQQKGMHYQSFYLVNAIHTKGDLNLIQELAEQASVQKIISDPGIQLDQPKSEIAEADFRDPDAVEWGIDMIGADQVWAMGYNGQGVTVAGEDTGYEWEHPAIKATYRGWDGTNADHNYHWHDAIHEISPLHNDPNPDPSLNPCGLDVAFPCDDNNHGTHTMGTMVGEDGANQIGVAPGAKWMACRNMERGYGSPSSYIECFEFFLAPTDLNGANPKPEMAPHVINNSWSCPEMEGCNPNNWAMMDDAVNNLKAAGVVVVVSAGNSGPGCGSVETPAAMLENSFTVGATDANDTIANFSSRGAVTVDGSNRAKPDISAPGRSVRSSVRGGAYASFSGTSMAGPHVAGLVALIISANPALAGQVDVIETIIKDSAVPKTTTQDCGGTPGSEVPNNTFGYGRIDAVAAVEAALILTSTTPDLILESSVAAFPNPVTQFTNLIFRNMEGQARLQVFNAAGQELLSRSLELTNQHQETIQMERFPSGVYFYHLEHNGQNYNGKLLKK